MSYLQKKISICMCTYNGEKFLRKQLDSLINQTVLPDEIIIYDDNSIDSSFEIIKSYKKNNTSINWIIKQNKENYGWKYSFYECLKESTGDIIFPCDQDDIWVENKIELMSEQIIKNNNILLLVTNPIYWYEEQNKMIKKRQKLKLKQLVNNRNFFNTLYPGCVFALDRRLLNEYLKIWEKNLAHDSLLYKLAYLNKGLYLFEFNSIYWRRHKESATARVVRPFTIEDYNERYETILLWEKYIICLDKTHFSQYGNRQLKKASTCLKERKKLYNKHSFTQYIKLFRFLSFYKSYKSFLLDIVALCVHK